jgi:ankyrin repeat protein
MNTKCLILLLIIIPLSILTDCSSKKEKKSDTISTLPVNSENAVPAPGLSIHDAALNGRSKEVETLLKSGTDPDTTDNMGRTPLMYAAFNGHIEIVGMLIRKGADVNRPDKNGMTALMMASSGPFPLAAKMLLDQGADPNMVENGEHFTALMYAAAEGQAEVVKILFLYKADPEMKDVDGDDALTFARNNGHKAVVELLESLKK